MSTKLHTIKPKKYNSFYDDKVLKQCEVNSNPIGDNLYAHLSEVLRFYINDVDFSDFKNNVLKDIAELKDGEEKKYFTELLENIEKHIEKYGEIEIEAF